MRKLFGKLSGYHLVLLTALISGVSIYINKFGVKGFNPFVFTGVKNIIVAMLLLSSILLLGNFQRLRNLSRRDLRNLILIGVTGGSIPFLLFFYGLKITNATKAAFMHKTMFIYVAILAFLFLGERLTKKQILACVGLLMGLFFLIGLPNSIDLGVILIFIATLFWAVETIISKHVLKEIPATIVAFGRMFFGSLIILSFLALTGQVAEIFMFSISQILWVLVTVAFLFGYVFTWYYGLQKIPASEATGILILGSVITTVLSVAESSAIALNVFIGMILILVSIFTLIVCSRAPRFEVAPRGI